MLSASIHVVFFYCFQRTPLTYGLGISLTKWISYLLHTHTAIAVFQRKVCAFSFHLLIAPSIVQAFYYFYFILYSVSELQLTVPKLSFKRQVKIFDGVQKKHFTVNFIAKSSFLKWIKVWMFIMLFGIDMN